MNDNNHKIAQILTFLEKEPNDCFLLHALALEKWKLNEVEDAKELFEQVLRIDETYVGTYYHLGHLWEMQGQLTKAMEVYAKGMEIAKAKKDMHALSELRSAFENIEND